jgi:pimeloyl-ACP methyl ester carboxylesterase
VLPAVYSEIVVGLNHFNLDFKNSKITIMKTLVKLLFVLICLGLCFACTEPEDMFEDTQVMLKKGKKKHHGLDQERYVVMKNHDNLKVHYRIIGKGPIDMVFIPGWTNPLTVYTKQFDYFRKKARCIYIDLPGHGLSDAPEGVEYTQKLMADAMYTIVKKEGLKKFIGVGFSWGATPLKVFEMEHPGMIEQLILLDIGIPTWPPMTEVKNGGQAAYFSSLTYEQKLAMMAPNTPPDLLEITSYWPDYPSWLMANLRYHYQSEENCQPYPWDIPIMVIYNHMNDAFEAKTRLHFPGCEIHLLGGDHHVIQWVDADRVNQLMDDFMIDRPGRKY